MQAALCNGWFAKPTDRVSLLVDFMMPSVSECFQSTTEWPINDELGVTSEAAVTILSLCLSGSSEENYKYLTCVASVVMMFEPGTSRLMQG